MQTTATRLVVGVGVSVLLLTACSGEETAVDNETLDGEATSVASDPGAGDTESDGATATPTSGAPTSVVIGGIQSLGGAYAAIGTAMAVGTEIGVEVLRSRYPDVDWNYIECDDNTEVEAAVACYERLVESEGADFLVGPPLTPATAAIDPLVREDEIMDAVYGGGYGGNTLNDNPYLVAALPSTQSTMVTTLEHATADGLENAFMISVTGALGDDCRSFWEDPAYEEWTSQVNYLGNVDVDPTTQDFSPTVSQVPDEADFTFLCASGGPGVLLASAHASAGLDSRMYTMHSQGQQSVAGAYSQAGVSNGSLYAPTWCIEAALQDMLPEDDPCAQATQELLDAAETAGIEGDVDILVGMAYDLTVMLGAACMATDCTGSAMSDYIFEGAGSTYQGVFGEYQYSPDRRRGVDHTNFAMARLEDGAWVVDDLMALE